MAVQKRKAGKSVRDHRRAQWMRSVKIPNVTPCPRCQEPKLSHRICAACGYYHDRAVLTPKQEEG